MLINLLYHDVTPAGKDDASGFSGPGAARYKLTPEEFKIHLRQLSSVTAAPPTVITVPTELRSDRSRNWMITFDDGGLSAITEIAESLEQHGWRGWFFIATRFLGEPTFCSRQQVLELHQRGHIIGSHSHTHPERISSCSTVELRNEWVESCKILSEIIGQPVTTASVPGGFYSLDVARAASKAGIKVLFNSEPTTTMFDVEGMLVLGRYNIYRGMSSGDAALLVSSPVRRWRQTAFWNMKKVAKVVAGPIYKAVRHRILSRDYNEKPS